MRACALSVVFFVSAAMPLNAACRVDSDRRNPADGEIVRLSRSDQAPDSGRFAVYRAALAVNTDGAPNSYHPDDFRGTSKAINRIDNGVAIRSQSGRRLSVTDRIEVFNRWRDGGWRVPEGYRINWKNVIAADPEGKPCTFSSGSQQGYFGSLTALKNGLSAEKAGECAVNDQLDQRYIPAIVLRGSDNPLLRFGARTGDLAFAINPETGAAVPAIVGDTGNGDRIGEGSVALNMALLGRTAQPKTYQEALGLDTGRRQMIVAVLPESRRFNPARPYTADNIRQRVEGWAAANGYGSTARLKEAVVSCATGL